METSWLQDFLTLAECGNFSRAERRHMTQPALSRRIRSLEDWVGTELIDRSTHQAALTVAGERFRLAAHEILRRLYQGQEDAREAAQATASTLRFASTHVLSLTFFPTWLRQLEAETPIGTVSLVADHMQACEQIMLHGEASFLLCHHHALVPTRLDPQSFLPYRLGGICSFPSALRVRTERRCTPYPGCRTVLPLSLPTAQRPAWVAFSRHHVPKMPPWHGWNRYSRRMSRRC